MKSMKKLVSLALCTAMLGSTIPGMNIAAAETTGKTEFWNDKMANTDQSKLDQMQESIKDLSGIDVELIAYPDTASYQTACSSPSAPRMLRDYLPGGAALSWRLW